MEAEALIYCLWEKNPCANIILVIIEGSSFVVRKFLGPGARLREGVKVLLQTYVTV